MSLIPVFAGTGEQLRHRTPIAPPHGYPLDEIKRCYVLKIYWPDETSPEGLLGTVVEFKDGEVEHSDRSLADCGAVWHDSSKGPYCPVPLVKVVTEEVKGGWQAQLLPLPGSPAIGTGRTEAMALVALFMRLNTSESYQAVVQDSYAVLVNGCVWQDTESAPQR